MCGIIGIIGNTGQSVSTRILEGLRLLEYRGYDSAGIATIHKSQIERRRVEGKIDRLAEELKTNALEGTIGIGHTRWATHGKPNVPNAHPHATESVAVVHNGIIENYLDIRTRMEKAGYRFETETDTEVVPVLITHHLKAGESPEQAVKSTIRELEGAFALGIIFSGRTDLLMAARRGSPLVIGYGEGEMYLGSDAIALSTLSRKIAYLEDGDVAALTATTATVWDENGAEVKRDVKMVAAGDMSLGKGNYRHYMLKEIYEQPSVVGEALSHYANPVTGEILLKDSGLDVEHVSHITIIACGTSFYAGMVARYWLEKLARVSVEMDVASEFRYREPIMPKGGCAVFISQSGETADTLAALRYARKMGQKIVVLTNVAGSSMAREADVVLPTLAGPEIGVAATKTFSAQLLALACFTIYLAQARGQIGMSDSLQLAHSLSEIPSRMVEVLNHDDAIRALSHELAAARDILYIGRGLNYPVAMEGALKLKEISYIHAEGTAAGELKHGPIALVDEKTPIIALAPSDALFDKMASNIREVAARGGKIILLSDAEGIEKLKDVTYKSLEMPRAHDFATPVLYAIPVQLLAYHVAVQKGTDVDQPRNLAKSVTVE